MALPRAEFGGAERIRTSVFAVNRSALPTELQAPDYSSGPTVEAVYFERNMPKRAKGAARPAERRRRFGLKSGAFLDVQHMVSRAPSAMKGAAALRAYPCAMLSGSSPAGGQERNILPQRKPNAQ